MSYPRNAFWSVCAVFVLAAPPAHGEGGQAWPGLVGASEVFQHDTASGVALGGLDPVSYFLPEGARPGRSAIELVWNGVAWRFSSEANRAAFQADPAAYAPRIGGYDAHAASQGRVVDADPGLSVVIQGRLYLFRTDASRARFLADEGTAARAEEHWIELRAGLVRTLGD